MQTISILKPDVTAFIQLISELGIDYAKTCEVAGFFVDFTLQCSHEDLEAILDLFRNPLI